MTVQFYTISRKFPISHYSFQHLALPCFLNLANLMGVKWYVIVILISLSLILNGFEHISCLLVFWVSFTTNYFFITLPILFLWLLPLFFLLSVLETSLLYSSYKSLVGFWLSNVSFQEISSVSLFSHEFLPWTEFLGYGNFFQTAYENIS